MLEKILVSVIAPLIVSVIFWLWSGIRDIPSQIVIPKGTVVAIKATQCPSQGWQPYEKAAGRFIVGVGTAPNGGPSFATETVGGAHSVVLTEGNLPQHQHDTLLAIQANAATWRTGALKSTAQESKSTVSSATALTSPVGASAPNAVPVLPPFVALTFCEKL